MPEKRTTLLMKQVSIQVNIWKMLILWWFFSFISFRYFFCNHCYSVMSYLKSMSELTNRSVQEGNCVHTKERITTQQQNFNSEYWEINFSRSWIPHRQRLNMPTRARLDFKYILLLITKSTKPKVRFVARTAIVCDDRSMVVANFTLLSRLS